MSARWLPVIGLASACQVFAGLGDFGPADDGAGASGAGANGAAGGAAAAGGAGAGGTSAGGLGGGGAGAGPGGGGTGNVPQSCFDSMMNGGETGVDCGGPCKGCSVGEPCNGAGDCATGICDGVSCACGDGLVISEYRARGPALSSDELVELYNASPFPITLDSQWEIQSRPFSGGPGYFQRWEGKGDVVPPYHHFLIGGATFSGGAEDDSLSMGIGDGSIVRLVQNGGVVDVLCTCLAIDCEPPPGECEGEVLADPNDGEDTDASLERKVGGAQGSCQDTDDNVADFQTLVSANPQTLADGPFPAP